MRLNDAHLINLSKASSHIDRQGWVYKRGERGSAVERRFLSSDIIIVAGMLNTSFKKRWFVLKGNLLFYFKAPTDKEPIGLIILGKRGVRASERDTVDDYFIFHLFDAFK